MARAVRGRVRVEVEPAAGGSAAVLELDERGVLAALLDVEADAPPGSRGIALPSARGRTTAAQALASDGFA